jgi:hypothetical protein
VAAHKDDQHTESGDYPWTRNIPDHAPREDSNEYKASRRTMHRLSAQSEPFYGTGQIEDHHGGGLWLKDDDGWFIVRNLVGVEWSAAYCADPAKVDKLRLNARRLYAAFPDAVEELGIRSLLDTPITDLAGVQGWVDSICNASVPYPRKVHQGTLPPVAGMHHYPAPVAEIELVKYDWFQLWHYDAGTDEVIAATPVADAMSDDHRTQAIFAAPAIRTVPAGDSDDQIELLSATIERDIDFVRRSGPNRGSEPGRDFDDSAPPTDGTMELPSSHVFSQEAFANKPGQ